MERAWRSREGLLAVVCSSGAAPPTDALPALADDSSGCCGCPACLAAGAAAVAAAAFDAIGSCRADRKAQALTSAKPVRGLLGVVEAVEWPWREACGEVGRAWPLTSPCEVAISGRFSTKVLAGGDVPSGTTGDARTGAGAGDNVVPATSAMHMDKRPDSMATVVEATDVELAGGVGRRTVGAARAPAAPLLARAASLDALTLLDPDVPNLARRSATSDA